MMPLRLLLTFLTFAYLFYVDVIALLLKNAKGVDTKYNITTATFSCLSGEDYFYVTPQLANCMTGEADEGAITISVSNYIHAYYKSRNIWLYGRYRPCFCCPNSPATYVKPVFDQTVSQMVIGENVPVFSYLFIDVTPCLIPKDPAHMLFECSGRNKSSAEIVQMLTDVINEMNKLQTSPTYRVPIFLALGIYTDYDSWIDLTWDSNAFSGYPLWYANTTQGTNDCNDWNQFSFGGWQPTFKQYTSNKMICGEKFNENICCDCTG